MSATRLFLAGATLFVGLAVVSQTPELREQLAELQALKIQQARAKAEHEKADAAQKQAAAYHQMVEDAAKLINAPFIALGDLSERIHKQKQEALDAEARREKERRITDALVMGIVIAFTLAGFGAAAFLILAAYARFLAKPMQRPQPSRVIIVRPQPKPQHRPLPSPNGDESKGKGEERILERVA